MTSLESYATSLPAPNAPMLAAVQEYIEWQTHHHAAGFVPTNDDDVDLRTYLSYLRINGVDPAALEDRIAALQRFYEWAKAEKIITHNPFEDYSLDISVPASGRARPQEPIRPKSPDKSEAERLRALSHISERLNGSVDIQSALEGTLETVLEVMGLQTAWVSMLADTHLLPGLAGDRPPHGFKLVAARGLPPGLEHEDRHSLRRPPACHCQHLLLEGRLAGEA